MTLARDGINTAANHFVRGFVRGGVMETFALWFRSVVQIAVCQFAKQNPVKNHALSCLNIPSQNVSFIITILVF